MWTSSGIPKLVLFHLFTIKIQLEDQNKRKISRKKGRRRKLDGPSTRGPPSARGRPPSAWSPLPSLYVHPLLMFHSLVSLWLAEFCQNACAFKIRINAQVWYRKYLDGSCNASKACFSLPFIVSSHFGFHDTLILILIFLFFLKSSAILVSHQLFVYLFWFHPPEGLFYLPVDSLSGDCSI